ncbi:MAG TPA: type II toxin-antitoxin system HicA family toxin [Geminicoccus sp.]|jgi:predicted RNA binding protein YcfA (HicA-like mRNA interferase family)|uniref:type II toxin-antitoxin system HicA family toxin n=1 Tax=Geminicoccus sp. TaxID=2024832 RepID=UPI002E349E24|nr:type II toxin-antitoxin system HicA family toxin [Geminicoccus sp.]HEX2528268.1 type II toxin-antitoxin system HicA family toxin [Geminicoccus sp.]
MKLPRDLDAPTLIRALRRVGYEVERQTGSHVRLRHELPDVPPITIPNHRPLKVGTLHAILAEVARTRGWSVARLLEELFG